MATSWDSKLPLILVENKLLKIYFYFGIKGIRPFILKGTCYLKQEVTYPWWASTHYKYRFFFSSVPHRDCTICNVQALLLDGFRRSGAYLWNGISSLQVICKKYQTKLWFLVEMLAMAKKLLIFWPHNVTC